MNAEDDKGTQSGVTLRSALVIAANPSRATWLLKPYIERSAMILMVGAEGTFKSFLALDWAMQLAMRGEAVVFLHAEGRGLWKRLRAWCRYHHPDRDYQEVLNGVPFLAVERPLNLNAASVVLELTQAVDAIGRRPALIVVDTMTRNSDGTIERSNEDATAYLNALDQGIRSKYGASVLLIHHIGHAARDRARGPFALIASTDANYLLERPDVQRPNVVVRSGRMKDCEPPAPFELEAHVVVLDEVDEDGKPVTSLVLEATGNALDLRPKPTGKAQKALLAALERLAANPDRLPIWTEAEIREIGRDRCGLHKNTARDASLRLRELGYLVPTIGGSYLAHLPPPALIGTERPNGTERPSSVLAPGTEKTERPLGLGLRSGPRSGAFNTGDGTP